MKFNVSSSLEYDVISDSTLILNVHALRTAGQVILEEAFTIEPYMRVEELNPVEGQGRYVRIEIPAATHFKVSYNALVDTAFKLVPAEEMPEVPVAKMENSLLPFLNPSRYCQSDKLYRLANNKFGKIENPFEKVLALTNWIYKNVEYLSGSTNSQTSAYDTVTEQAGVCRDFAHLGIALCRALTIPARYCTAYSYKLKPADFHACFEVFLGGQWIIFDATKLTPLNGLVKIASGRDAADAAIANMFGDVNFLSMSVNCELAEDDFEPLFYTGKQLMGISYF